MHTAESTISSNHPRGHPGSNNGGRSAQGKVRIRVAEGWGMNVREIIKRTEFAGVSGAEEVLSDLLWRSSTRWVAYVDEEPACVWGLVPRTLLSHQAYLWLLTTDVAAEHKFLLVRYSQLFVETALKNFEELYGHVDTGNPSAKRWLKWLGAEFGATDGTKMHFVIRRAA